MNRTYIKENSNRVPKNREDFINQLEKTCNAFDVTFSTDDEYKTMTKFLLDMFSAMMKYQRCEE